MRIREAAAILIRLDPQPWGEKGSGTGHAEKGMNGTLRKGRFAETELGAHCGGVEPVGAAGR